MRPLLLFLTVNPSVFTFNPRRFSIFLYLSSEESVTTLLSRAEMTLGLMRNYCHLVAVIMEGIYPLSTMEEQKEKMNNWFVSSFIL